MHPEWTQTLSRQDRVSFTLPTSRAASLPILTIQGPRGAAADNNSEGLKRRRIMLELFTDALYQSHEVVRGKSWGKSRLV